PRDLVGKKIDNLRLSTLDGKMLRLYDLADRKVIVIAFVSFDCPVSNDYLGSLIELYQAHKERVAFLAVAPTTDSVEELQKQAREYKVPFPVVRDDRLHVADALAARTTPEVMVLDGDCVLRYRGRIDDGYAARLKKNPEVKRHDLRLALEEVIAGKPVSVAV